MYHRDKNCAEAFADLALIVEDELRAVDYLYIDAVNYTYVNFKTGKMVLLGTEGSWLHQLVTQGLHQQIAPRLKQYAYDWQPSSALYQAYQQHLCQQNYQTPWFKTDFGMPSSEGFHLLDIRHQQPLDIESINKLEDLVCAFKDESKRLQLKYPQMVMQAECLDEILATQAQMKAEAAAALLHSTLELDPALFEPLPEPALSDQEETALEMRCRWMVDDEIADEMGLSIREVKGLFQGIKDKYHQPRIPQHVYRERTLRHFSQVHERLN
jgi:DNA-binding CsgD family transcriptional regulator